MLPFTPANLQQLLLPVSSSSYSMSKKSHSRFPSTICLLACLHCLPLTLAFLSPVLGALCSAPCLLSCSGSGATIMMRVYSLLSCSFFFFISRRGLVMFKRLILAVFSTNWLPRMPCYQSHSLLRHVFSYMFCGFGTLMARAHVPPGKQEWKWVTRLQETLFCT